MSTVGFWRELRQDNRSLAISSNRLGSIGNVFFLFPQGGGPRNAFTTFTDIKSHLRSRDIIVLGGVLREQAVAPLDVYDVQIIGAANQPRQSTSGGVPTGGGASWLAPTSPVASTPLLEVRAAGWQFSNIEFTPANASAAIRLTRSAVVDTIDASHAIFDGCYFAGNGGTTQIGIEDNGGCRSALITDCRFEGLGDTAIKGLTTAAAIPLAWQIQDSRFQQNLNDIKMSLSYAAIQRNKFMTAGSGATNKVISTVALSGQGGNNQVLLNFFSNAAANIQISNGYSGAATDMWSNYPLGTAALSVTSPPGA